MPYTVYIHEVGFVSADTVGSSVTPPQWITKISDGSRSINVPLSDPCSRLESKGLKGLGPEATIAWYLDNYTSEPFEATKCELAAKLLATYGRDLASQLAASDWLPRSGHLQLQILTPRRTDKSPDFHGPSIQHLHWEVLEDIELWPSGFNFDQVSVVRSLTGLPSTPVVTSTHGDSAISIPSRSKAFNILLVVSRPYETNIDYIDYQLVARSLVAIVDQISNIKPEVKMSLKILRPPTWHAFRKHMHDFRNHYDLVHFDMKGLIQTENNTGAVLEFCEPDWSNPLKMKKDLKLAGEVGKELANAGVRTVILNACESASFRDSAPESNLAEVLLGYGMHSVLAMAYKVTEEAVEIFMSAFYHSLLVEGASIEHATRTARCALLRNRSRRAWYMQRVQLADFVVPVLYVSKLSYEAPETENTITASSSRQGTDSLQGLLGRDYNILSLETHMSVSPLVLLYGQGGVGKTELLRYACSWWKSSGWIKAAAYIDFDQQELCLYNSMESVASSIAHQLQFQRKELSVDGIIDNLRTEKYLIVFDSAEAFETDNPLDEMRAHDPDGLATQLAAFIDKVTDQGSMVIVASRLCKSKIAPGSSNHLKYCLPGLSVLDSVTLLQNLTFKSGQEIPDIFHRHENIDLIRRAAILLEGNPLALRLIVPELKKANYNGEVLLDILLYGVCTTLRRTDLSLYNSRFERSFFACNLDPFLNEDDTGMAVYHLAPFWNLMPRNLEMFYWFLYLNTYDGIPEYGVKTWLSEDFRLLVNMAPLGQKIRAERHKWERKLISTGILDHATVIKEDDGNCSSMLCYHVHPVCTLLSRALLSEEGWKLARFAYLRASILWESHDLAADVGACSWAQVSWDDTGAQHEDHLYNWRHIALAWYVRDGNPLEEELRTGVPLSIFVYNLVHPAVRSNPRHGRLVIPHLTTHLLQRLNIVDLFRPNQVPTALDLSAILTYSWDLWTLETDLLQSPHAKRAAIVDKALDVYHRRVEAVVTTAEPIFLDPTDEASYQQLLHAAASTAFDTGDFLRAKALYEAHLATSPVTTDFKMLNLIRRKQFQSLMEWNTCVFIIARCMGDVDDKVMRGLMRSFLDMVGDSGKPGGLPKALAKVMKEHAEEFGKKRVRDDVAFGLQREPETVKKFGWFARRLLEEPLYVVNADVFDREVRDPDHVLDDLSGAGAAASISGEARGRIVVERMGEWLASTVKAMKQPGVQAAPDTTPIIMSLSDLESTMRMYAGNPTGTAATLRNEVAREALSSTTNTGWQRLAELHMLSYMSAVKETAEPDYKKGLTHLNEWWNLHQGQEMSKRSQCCALIDFVTCYHGLNQVAEASKAVIKLVLVGKSMVPADCLKGDVEATHDWLYETIFAFDKLHVFLDSKAVFSAPPEVELGWTDRAMIWCIMTEAKERDDKKQKLKELKCLGEALINLVRTLINN